MRSLATAVILLLGVALGVGSTLGPVQAQTSTAAGGAVYKTYCAVCHGTQGKGDGQLAGSLRSAPPDLTLLAQNNGGEYPAEDVARIIDGRNPLPGHGGPDMPIWGDAFKNAGTDDEEVARKIQSIVDFLERRQKK